VTCFHLVRHGLKNAPDGLLPARTPGIGLSAQGRRQIEGLIPLLIDEHIDRVFASPLQRAQESALLLAQGLALSVETLDDLNEVDLGDWTGRSFTELEQDAAWNRYNEFRSGARVPHGEAMIETQSRVVSRLLALRDQFPDGRLLVVSHGDVIRAALLHFLGMPLDFVHRLRIDMGSLTSLRIDAHGVELFALNRLA
jgi:probable phosphoglycerate mutase